MDYFLGLFEVLPWILLFTWTIYSALSIFRYNWMIEKRLLNYYQFESIPSVFTNLGLFGTFLGIMIGLVNFDTDPNQIKESIAALLNGLRLAFQTSLYGIFFSIVSSKLVKRIVHRGIAVDPDQDEQVKLLTSIDKNLETMSTSIANSIDNAIVNSLKSVVEDVNETFKEFIDQLISDNFQRLTDSIDQLVEWQKKYKQDIEAITSAYDSLIEKHQDFVDRTEDWLKTLDEITGNSSKLKEIIEEFKALTDDDSRFKDIIQKTVESTDQLNNTSSQIASYVTKLNDVQEHLAETKDDFKESMKRTLETFGESAQSHNEAFDQSISKIDGWLNREEGVLEQVHTLSAMLERLRQFEVSDIEKLDESFNNRLQSTFRTLDDLMKQLFQDYKKGKS
ncbi:MotA/TolQ/ExbB proton channel family protein [Roseivirga pacifica]|uniref:MotA/TolQ/ExbB proton channel family protein n=1 Tax=Roseivirga pacifica TaxID=1267423 RepID=UPI003BA93A24